MSKFCRGKYLKDTGKFYILNKSHNQTFLLHDIFLYLILCTNFFPWHFSLHEFFFDFFPTSPVTFLMALSLVVLRNFFSYFLSCLFRLFRLFLFCQLFFATFSYFVGRPSLSLLVAVLRYFFTFFSLFLFTSLLFSRALSFSFSRCSSVLLCLFFSSLLLLSCCLSLLLSGKYGMVLRYNHLFKHKSSGDEFDSCPRQVKLHLRLGTTIPKLAQQLQRRPRWPTLPPDREEGR